MEKNRVNYFDIAKGIGMVCVILEHLSLSAVNMVVFTFHMPLFFIISGYFLKKQDMKLLVRKKFRQLLIPYFLTCLAIVGLSAARIFFWDAQTNLPKMHYYGAMPDFTEAAIHTLTHFM